LYKINKYARENFIPQAFLKEKIHFTRLNNCDIIILYREITLKSKQGERL
jgi:hypothetical protein